MIFDCNGYQLIFIQKEPCKDSSAHLFSLIYKFYSHKTNLWYIVRCDYHKQDVFAIKFYCKKDKSNKFKYSVTTNKGDVGNILITCLKVIPLLLQDYNTASFCFVGASRIDLDRAEGVNNNIRYRLYSKIARNLIGDVIFTHYTTPEISGYLLINNHYKDKEQHKNEILTMFATTYNEINIL